MNNRHARIRTSCHTTYPLTFEKFHVNHRLKKSVQSRDA